MHGIRRRPTVERKPLDTISGRRADGGSAPLRLCDPTEPRVARVHTT
jgi:hypothetical protein